MHVKAEAESGDTKAGLVEQHHNTWSDYDCCVVIERCRPRVTEEETATCQGERVLSWNVLKK